jgi:hypothetical protein
MFLLPVETQNNQPCLSIKTQPPPAIRKRTVITSQETQVPRTTTV